LGQGERLKSERCSVASATPGYIGPYRLLNVVHTGQSSQIWQAIHDGSHQLFAVKTPLERFRRDREHVGYLRREFTIGQTVSHPRLIKIHEFGSARGIPFIAMDWFGAPNMKQRLLSGADKIAHLLPRIIEQAAEGLEHFHGEGWVHRDVKPDNFLVADDGEVKVIDFSLAQRAKRSLGKLLARKQKVQGTLSYMAPEQIRGAWMDQRADIYSFGCTLYHLIVGRPPFTGGTASELLTKHLKAPPPALEAADRNVTPEFSQLIRRTMAKDPDGRPQSLTDFLVEFRMHRMYRKQPKLPEEISDKKAKG
jgi:serine/threonine protein kinase